MGASGAAAADALGMRGRGSVALGRRRNVGRERSAVVGSRRRCHCNGGAHGEMCDLRADAEELEIARRVVVGDGRTGRWTLTGTISKSRA